MGSDLSIPKGRDTPSILQFILQEMFRRTDLADIYSLADPERCKRYIVVATDALESLFLKLNLEPRKGPDGTLYVQSIEGLVKSIPPEQRARQRENCTELAFFFIRIFQIFGALFLSIYDSRLPSRTPGDDEPRQYRNRDEGPFASPNSLLGLGQRGGYLSETRSFYIKDSPYDILNYHLMTPKSVDSRDPMKFDEKKYNLILDQYSIYDFPAEKRELKAEPKPRIGYYHDYLGTTLYLLATLEVQKANNDDSIYEVRLVDFEERGSNWPPIQKRIKNISPERLEQVQGPNSPPLSQGLGYSKTKGNTLPSVLDAMFKKAIITMLGEPPLSVVKFLKDFRYLSQSGDKADKISGTHAYVLRGQENQSTVDIVLAADRIQIDRKGRTVNISIEAKLKIMKRGPSRDDVQNRSVYRVELSFDDSRVKPREYEYLLSGYKNKHEDFLSDSEGRAPTSDRSLTIPQFIEMVFKDIMKRIDIDDRDEYESTRGFQRTREGLVKPYDSNRIAEPLKIKKLWEAMARDPPVKAHCIARAVQLLSVEAIKGDLSKQAYSSVCKLKFAYTRDGSLPTPGRSVVSSSGVYALSLLFFEGLKNDAPRILDSREYEEYLRSLTYLFEKHGSLDDVDTIEPITEISERVPKFCAGVGDRRLPLSDRLARNLQGVTRDLIQQQQSHIQKALSIIFDLFDLRSIERDRKLKFSPRILSGGMPEIDRISEDARRLLLEYYKRCELTYREGLVMVYDATRSRNNNDFDN